MDPIFGALTESTVAVGIGGVSAIVILYLFIYTYKKSLSEMLEVTKSIQASNQQIAQSLSMMTETNKQQAQILDKMDNRISELEKTVAILNSVILEKKSK